MKIILTLAIITGLIVGLTGCNSEEDKLQAERKSKREQMKQPVDTKSNNAPTKLPF